MNTGLRIVSRAEAANAGSKLLAAGANAVVSTARLGGLRVVSELLNPSVTSFLDGMLREKGKNVRVAEVVVEAGSYLDGKTLGDARLGEDPGVPVIAVRAAIDAPFTFEVGASRRLEPGTVLIVLGSRAKVDALEALARAKGSRAAPRRLRA